MSKPKLKIFKQEAVKKFIAKRTKIGKMKFKKIKSGY